MKNNRASPVLLTILFVGIAISALAWTLSYLIAHPATYEITGNAGVLPPIQFYPQPPQNPIYFEAMALFKEQGVRPYWIARPLKFGASTTLSTADEAIAHLIPCESAGKSVNDMDANGKTSMGILQFQDWKNWEKLSSLTGNPDDINDAIHMAEWAIMNGRVSAWSCARILGVVPK